jgi:vacuolar-type H+-ATPase subunit I/STV1
VRAPSEEPITLIKAVPVRSKKGDFIQLPKVWSEPQLCGPQSTLFLDDPELKIIQDLGPAGRSKAITDGVIATMKALEVAAALNNASLESEVRVDALAQERDALIAKVAALEEDQRKKRSVAEERDRQLAVLKEQLTEARTALEQAVDSSRKLAEEKVSLEEALKKADLPGEDEGEDLAVLRRADLVDRVGELEGSLVDAVKLGFDRAVAQLKMVNPNIDLNVEGTHPLSDVKDGAIIPPPGLDEDNGHVDEGQA